MPRTPRGKRIVTADGDVAVAAKNPNGDGSVYFEAARRFGEVWRVSPKVSCRGSSFDRMPHRLLDEWGT